MVLSLLLNALHADAPSYKIDNGLFCRWELCLCRDCFWRSNCRACPALAQSPFRILSQLCFHPPSSSHVGSSGLASLFKFQVGHAPLYFYATPLNMLVPFPSMSSPNPSYSHELLLCFSQVLKSLVKPLSALLLPFLTPQSQSFILCTLQELYTCFKETNPFFKKKIPKYFSVYFLMSGVLLQSYYTHVKIRIFSMGTNTFSNPHFIFKFHPLSLSLTLS